MVNVFVSKLGIAMCTCNAGTVITQEVKILIAFAVLFDGAHVGLSSTDEIEFPGVAFDRWRIAQIFQRFVFGAGFLTLHIILLGRTETCSIVLAH